MRHHRFHIGVDIVILSKQIVFVIRVTVEGIIWTKDLYEIDLALAF